MGEPLTGRVDGSGSVGSDPVTTGRLVLAFAAVYIIWGSTYLAIRIVIETMPPFFAAGTRYLAAGTIVYGWTRATGSAGAPEGRGGGADRVGSPNLAHWRTALVVGATLLLGGNGLVFWAEQTVASGPAALLVAIVPLWMAVLGWSMSREIPTPRAVIGLVLGFGGVALLIGPGLGGPAAGVDVLGAGALVLASFFWAFGSLYSRTAPHPASQLVSTSMAMLAGGGLLMVTSLLTGELPRLNLAAFSLRSILAWTYLVVFGSIIAFTAYLWLMRATTPSRAATYAYVNPVVAVLLGWLLAGEALTVRIGVAAAVIVGSVGMIVAGRQTGGQVDR